MDVDNTGTGGGCMAGMEVVMDVVVDRAGNGCIRGNGSGESSLGGADA